MAKRASIRDWLEEALSDPDKDGECSAIALVHRQGTAKAEVHTWKFKGPNARKWTAQELAPVIEKKLAWASQDMQGPQTFNLLPFYGSATEPAGMGFPVMVNPNNESEGLATEGPHGTGLTMQSMRHTEVMFSQGVKQQAALFDAMAGTIRHLAEMNKSLMHENAESFAIAKELILEKGREDHRMRMEEIKAQGAADLKNRILSMAPALMNTLTGKEVFPQSAADTALIEALAEGMSQIPQEKLLALAEVVPPALIGPLMARATDILEKKRQQKAEISAIVQSSPAPVEGELLDGPEQAKAAQ